MMRVLYVDDDEVDRQALARLVARCRLRWDLVTLGSVAAALAALHQSDSPFDVAILDYRLGDGSGLDVLSHLGPTPGIIITGQGSEKLAAEAIEKGALGYVIKDPDRTHLRRLPLVVDQVLERRKIETLLHRALAQIAMLHGVLPLCGNCQKARGDDGLWQPLAALICDQAEITLRDELCPDCRQTSVHSRQATGDEVD